LFQLQLSLSGDRTYTFETETRRRHSSFQTVKIEMFLNYVSRLHRCQYVSNYLYCCFISTQPPYVGLVTSNL